MRLTVLFVCLLAAGALAASPASAQLRTGIWDDRFDTATPEPSMGLTAKTGASVVRLVLYWGSVAKTQPVGNATDPNNVAYDWTHFDRQVQAASDKNLRPLVTITGAPDWAHDGNPNTVPLRPQADDFGRFAEAAARRYTGIRWWMAWNEPNRRYFLRPQLVGTRVESAEIYRDLVNAFAAGVKAANPDNLVVAGGLAPLGNSSGPSPMRFMRALLSEPVRFDVWSHHPYTSGGPTHKAAGSGNIALGNLPTMRKFLYERWRANRIITNKRPQFWVTEFSWDTKPPDRHIYALPMKLHSRWTAEALYRMWRQGITTVIWFKVRDDPWTTSRFQSGFYFANGAAKRSLRAFRFPTVAFRQPGRILVWGRTPTSTAGKVVIQIRIAKRWRNLTTLRANGNGIFTRSIRTPYRNGVIRARYRAQNSLGFSLTPVPNRYVHPFGCGGGSSCTS